MIEKPPVLLALETSTERMSAAILTSTGAIFSRDGEGGAKASRELITLTQGLMAEHGVAWADLDAIAFGQGPGAFTGLRTACSVAQGFALGHDLPLIPVNTLQSVAQEGWDQAQGAGQVQPGQPLVLWVAQDARMGEMYVQPWSRSAEGRWHARRPPALCRPEDFPALWQADEAFVAALAVPGQVALAGSALGTVLPEALCPAAAMRWPDAWPSARAAVVLAQTLWQAGAAVDAALALPLYVRDKVAQTSAERARQGGQA